MKPVRCKNCGETIADADDLAFNKLGQTTRKVKCKNCGAPRTFHADRQTRKA